MCFRSPKKGQSEERRVSDAHSMHLRHQKKVKRNDLQYYSVIKPNWYTFTNPINQEMRRWPRITKKTSLFLKGSMVLAAALFTHWQVWPHLNFRMSFNDAGPGEDMVKCCTRITNWNSGLKTIPENIWKPLKNPWKLLKVQIFVKSCKSIRSPNNDLSSCIFQFSDWGGRPRGRQWESACQQSFEPWLLLFPMFCTSTNEDTPPITSLPWCYYTIVIKAFCLYHNRSSLSHPINNFHLAHLRSQLHMHTASCSIAMLSFSQQLLRLLACSG